MPSIESARDPAKAKRPPTSGPLDSRPTPTTSSRRGSWRARMYWLGDRRPRRRPARRARARHRRRTPRGGDRTHAPGGTFLDGGQHGWRWPSRSACGRASSTAAPSRTRSKPCCASIPHSRRDRPIARSGAGTSRCRACSAAATRQSEEHLAQSLTYDPDSTASHYFLAETLFDDDRDREAREELQQVIAAPDRSGLGARGHPTSRRRRGNS